MKKVTQNKQNNNQKTSEKEAFVGAITTKQSSFLPLIIAFSIPVLLYLQTISFGFTHFDDDRIILNNLSFLSDFNNGSQAFTSDAFMTKGMFYRPLQTLSFMIDTHLSKAQSATMFHVTNVLLIGLIACALFLFLKKFFVPQKIALLGTLIFCTHPLFVSSIAWIPARGDLMLTLFALVSFLFFMQYLQKGKSFYLFLHWLAFTIALFCKETAVMLPLLFMLYLFAFAHEKRFKAVHILIILLYVVSGVVWFWLRTKATITLSDESNMFGLSVFIANVGVIFESIAKFMFPFDFAPIPSFSFVKIGCGIVICGSVIFLVSKNKERTTLQKLFCFAWFLLLLLPTMFFKHPFIDYLDHRFFLPLIGIILCLLILIPKQWIHNGTLKKPWIAIVVIICLCLFTVIKSTSYADAASYYNATIRHNPHSVIAYNNRGTIRFKVGDKTGALNDFNHALSLNSHYNQAYFNRANVKSELGDKKGAIADYTMAIEGNAEYGEAYFNRGNTKADINDNHSAIDDYNKSIELNPTQYYAFINRGVAKSKTGDLAGGIDDFNRAIAINPYLEDAYNNLGMTMTSMGNYEEAMEKFNQAIKINPQNMVTLSNRAIVRFTMKDFTGAIADCEVLLKVHSNDAKMQRLKAAALQQMQRSIH